MEFGQAPMCTMEEKAGGRGMLGREEKRVYSKDSRSG